MLAHLRRSRVRVPVTPVHSIRCYTFGTVWLETYMSTVNRLFRNMADDEKITQLATSKYIDKVSWLNFMNSFRRRIIKEPVVALGSEEALRLLSVELDSVIAAKDNEEAISRFKDYMVKTIMLPEAEIELKDVVESYKTLSTATDLRVPHQWYPKTRLMKRKIIYHGGPTNSGKTYQALQRLAAADPAKGGGLYCGPLRLLALEVYEKLNRQGVLTSLSTGQEKREMPCGTHTSATLEMVSVDKEYDVAVIDEIQMISDPDRGYAWTRAVLGLQAREIHVCGGLEAMHVVESLAASCGDEFVLQSYNRLSTLEIEAESLKGDYTKVQPGDCIVAFSKADIFSIRRQIESTTKYKCAVIYGALPPETRSTQARLFNDDNTGYDILVASDAIGMGLNLNIRRTIFHTTAKFTNANKGIGYMDPSAIKQIAGRAGRLSSNYPVGKVTAWQEADLAYVRAVMSFDVPVVEAAGIFPSVEQIQHFSTHLEKIRTVQEQQALQVTEESADKVGSAVEPVVKVSEVADTTTFLLSRVMERFVQLSRLEGKYFLCEHENLVTIANWLQPIPLTIPERFLFATAPATLGCPVTMYALYEFAAKYALGHTVALNIRLSRALPKTLDEFTNLCLRHNILELYLWLSFRYPKYFVEQDNCLEQKEFAIKQIEEYLRVASNASQEFTHYSNYAKSRKSLLNPPAESFPAIRSAFLENMLQVNKEESIILPPSAYIAKSRKDYYKKKQTN